MGLRLQIPAISDSGNLPAAPAVPHPLKRAGTISLIDPAYPSQPWGPNIPASVPNLAGGEPFAVASTIKGIVERSGKKGFHSASDKSATAAESVTFSSAEVRQKIADAVAAGHQLGIVEVYQITRESAADFVGSMSSRWAGVITNGSTNDVATLRVSNTGSVIGYQRARVVAEKAGTTLIATGGQAAATVLTGSGAPGPSTAPFLHHNGGAGSKQATRITYLHLVENLTLSKITPEQFLASVDSWTAEVFGPNGRYANDTWTPVTPH